MERYKIRNTVGKDRTVPGKQSKYSQKAADAKINCTLLLVMAVLILLTAATAVGEITFLKSGSIDVSNDGYTKLKDQTEIFAAESATLSTAKITVPNLDLTVPDYCPVNYKAAAPIAMVYDSTAEKVLYAKNVDERCSPASLSKLMTAAVAMDLAPDGFQFVAGDELGLVPEDASSAGISKCYAFNKTEMSDGLILKGSSDISYTAAACLGRLLGDESDVSPDKAVGKFIDKMNLTAKDIGAVNTHFSNPDGYYDENNYTTASDMMRIAVYAAGHKEIASSASKAHISGKFASGQSYEWLNTNHMVVPEDNLYYEYATGLKVGRTKQSGHCIALTASRYGHDIFCVVMSCETDEDRYADAKNLMDITFSYLEEQGASEPVSETEAEILEG